MKKYFYLLLVALCITMSTEAAPGDTTWVNATNAQLSWYGNYDSTIVFPSAGKSYRSIYMVFTLGKYMCPGSPTYCGDWDYTVLNYLILPNGKSYEMGRLITPYANAGDPRTPWTWAQHYVFDVTDFAPLLHDTATIRTLYSGYSGGFTENIKFMFIEGAPDREVTGIHRIYTGSYGYGGTPDINSHFPIVRDTAPDNTKSATLKFLVTGHGSDANGCCEFMPHSYDAILNGRTIGTQLIWRDDCGSNELYPQSGTWIYQRSNWCPGSQIRPYYHDLPGVTAGSDFNVGIQFEPYTGGGSYTTEGILFYYGSMKKILDASIENIVAPTNDENFFRENPICGSPVIRIKNHGSANIDSVRIAYGLKDSLPQFFTWKGTLKTFDETDVTLPPLMALNTVSGDTAQHTFMAKIIAVNGGRDADSTNNSAASRFTAAPRWPSTFRIAFKANSEPMTTGSSICETSWFIYDMFNHIVAKRDSATIKTLYTDTIKLRTGYYKLVVYDSSCDGLQWWAMSGQPGYVAGSLTVKKIAGNATIPMHGYDYSTTYNNDFGCGFTQYFYTVDTATLAINEITESNVSIEAYPNPAQDVVNIDLSGLQDVNGTIQVFDAMGRVAKEIKCTSAHQQVDVKGLVSGMYTIVFADVNRPGDRLTTRLLITK